MADVYGYGPDHGLMIECKLCGASFRHTDTHVCAPSGPPVTWRYIDDGELALFWTNPWDGKEEKIATFWWPTHPIEETSAVEKMFEDIAEKACRNR
jgi:hypothetical protein